MNNDFMNKITTKIKNISGKVYFQVKGFLIENVRPFVRKNGKLLLKHSRNISVKVANEISVFYKNHILPFSKKTARSVKEFTSLLFRNSKTDSRELLGNVSSAFSGLKLYLGLAFRNSKSVFSGKSNLIYNVKYLSYKKLILYSIAFIIFDIFLLWFCTFRVLYAKHHWEGNQEKKFFIRPGKNLDDIIDELKENDIIKNKFIFKVYVKISGKENQIISKRYLFVSGICNSELLNILTDRNMIQMEKFTVIEGLEIKQIAKIAENKLQLSPEKFIKETENDSLINMLGLKGKIKNLEGFLFPETYHLPLNVDEKDLVNILFNEFRKRVLNNDEIKEQLNSSNKKLLDVIILASIIQGETNLKEEMGTISGVYNNRLKIGMKLEADPTIQYILPDGHKAKLKYNDLKIDSPYNTYKNLGLPPGPINNPGIYAIKASLNPEKNNYLFFVATGNGGHKFSATYQQHLIAVEEYKKNTEKK